MASRVTFWKKKKKCCSFLEMSCSLWTCRLWESLTFLLFRGSFLSQQYLHLFWLIVIFERVISCGWDGVFMPLHYLHLLYKKTKNVVPRQVHVVFILSSSCIRKPFGTCGKHITARTQKGQVSPTDARTQITNDFFWIGNHALPVITSWAEQTVWIICLRPLLGGN